MKRTQTRKNKHADTNPDISQLRVSTPKRSRDTENSKTSILDSNVQRVKVSSCQNDGENVVVESSYNMKNSENGNSYKFQHKRLQQPPAHINTNLMKIKMEVDYVPIVAVKPEPAEDQDLKQEIGGDNNENGQVNSVSPSFHVQSRENNASSRSAQNANQDNYEFQELDPERRKQQKQEEEETGENPQISNARGEREKQIGKNEKETVVKLEEEIKKYSKNVISLQRENTEIQTTLQKEIDELKLVNEQKQTNINALNSVLAQQWTEINQLKSQMAEQQKQNEELKNKVKSSEKEQSERIHDLNSTITLQRDENKGLKCQVEEQRKQIEELNNKLKPTAKSENPQSVDSSNSNAGQVKINHLPTNVLSRIFGYLELKSLKQSRLVCRRWRNEAGNILLQNFYLVCDGKEKCENALLHWLTNSNSNSASKVKPQKLWAKGKNDQGTLQLLRKFKKIRNSTTELIFSPAQPLTENLYEILLLLPNLQVLETKALNLSPRRKWLVNDESLNNTNEIPVKLQLLIQKLETLKKLKLDFAMTKAISTHFFHHRQQFESIKSLELRVIGMDFMSSFHNWTITRLTLVVQENYDVRLIRSFLMKISASLKSLKFTFSMTTLVNNSLSYFQPWADDWIIPIELNKVETLEIEHAFGRKFVLKSIVVALQLPRLKKLSVGFIPEDLEEIIHQWNSHESANGRKLFSESLEELTSWFASTLNSKKIPRNPWPRLKSLKCSFKGSEFSNASFLSELRNLERLELSVDGYWTTDKTTWRKDEAGDNRSSQSAEFQLRDLKNLKSFYLRFYGEAQWYQDFANSLVAKDLKFMKSLQRVQFCGIVINPEPLRSALGPNVPIIFTDCNCKLPELSRLKS